MQQDTRLCRLLLETTCHPYWFSCNDRFHYQNGYYNVNPKWLPRMVAPKNQPTHCIDKKYKPSQQSMHSLFTSIIAFFKFLINEEHCFGNPAAIAKTDCRYFIADAQVKSIKRLTEEQWQYVIKSAVRLADHSPDYERNLFIIVTLKTLFLRISELSERDEWIPEMPFLAG